MIDIEEIKNLLPHRYPFLLVDRVEELVIVLVIKSSLRLNTKLIIKVLNLDNKLKQLNFDALRTL